MHTPPENIAATSNVAMGANPPLAQIKKGENVLSVHLRVLFAATRFLMTLNPILQA